jgi:DNA-binding NtrC family response regulator
LATAESEAIGVSEPHILVGEDNQDLRRVFVRALALAGCRIHRAATLTKTRTVLAQSPLDVFLCDVNFVDERSADLLRERISVSGGTLLGVW